MAKWFLLLLICFLVPQAVYADENFDVEYDMFYRVVDKNSTQVTQTTSLINKKTNLYATEFELLINGQLEGDVSGFDDSGNLEVISEKTDKDRYKIKVMFNQKVVGIGNKVTFFLNYKLTNLINSVGRIYEIAIPKPGKDAYLSKYLVKISIPKSLGQIGFIKPNTSYQETDVSYIITFTQNEAKNGILVGVGDVAHFQFKLLYHLKNESILPKTAEIALPPDTRFQQIFYSLVNPKPVNVRIDEDGNWLAAFELKPKQSLEVAASGSALIYTQAQDNFKEAAPLAKHSTSDKFWESDNEEVQTIAKSLTTAENIYSYITTTLSYNYKRVNSLNRRMGAKLALQNPKDAICMEFTDSFIALARASGIPAREVNGYAYTSDDYLKPLSLVADVLHSWPEYWDSNQKLWIPVDPTWATTTGGLDYFTSLDFNHFVFVRRGVSSTYPYPAGSYRFEEAGKDVDITIKNDLPLFLPSETDFSVNIPKTILSSSKQTFTISLFNRGGMARYNIPLDIVSDSFKIAVSEPTPNLPPFGKKDIIVTISQQGKKFWASVPIKIVVDGREKVVNIQLRPIVALYFPLTVAGFIVLSSLVIIIFRKHVQKGRA